MGVNTTSTFARKDRRTAVPGRRCWSDTMLAGALVSDLIAVIFGGALGYQTVPAGLPDTMQSENAAVVIAGMAVIAIGLFGLLSVYRLSGRFSGCPGWRHTLPRFTAGWTLLLLALLGLMGLTGRGNSVEWLVPWYGLTLLLLIGNRALLNLWRLQGQAVGSIQRNVVVVGTGEALRRTVERLRTSAPVGVALVGVFDAQPVHAVPELYPAGLVAGLGRRRDLYPTMGGLAELVEFARGHHVDDVLVAMPLDPAEPVATVVRDLADLPVDVHLVPGLLSDLVRRMGPGAGPLAAAGRLGDCVLLPVAERPLKGWNGIAKRTLDLALALAALVAFGPLLCLIALGIKASDPGPVFFRQPRFGFNNSVFDVWKFRTMRVSDCDGTGARRTVRGDPRVFPFGAFLRRTSLDELPQLINVLKGEMSLVGPRAHAVAMRAGDDLYHEAVDRYAARHRVPPGLTGWAQVNGLRGEVDSLEKARGRVALDLHYVENWSLALDLRVLVRTVRVIWRDTNAY